MRRRGFLQMLGIAPVAAQAAGAEIAANAAQSLSPLASGLAIGSGGSTNPWDVFNRSPDYMALLRRANRLDAKRNAAIRTAEALDPDIAVLRSVPLTTKIRMQIDREVELERQQTILDRALESLREQLVPGWAKTNQPATRTRWFYESRESEDQ